MARPSKYSVEDLLDVSRDIVVESGPAALTVSAVARIVGAPSGSLYHRFASRDELAAALWVRSVRHFQEAYLSRLDDPDPLKASLEAAVHVVTWSRANLNEARLLVLFRGDDLVLAAWPEHLRTERRRLRRELSDGIKALQDALGATTVDQRRRVTFGIVDVPYAAVRPALLAGQAPPESTESLVIETVRHALRPLTDRLEGATP